MYLVMFVLDDCSHLDTVLDAWAGIGIRGVTICESTGFHRRRTLQRRIPLRFDFERLAGPCERGNYTLFTIAESVEMVQKALAAAEQVVGDLDQPNTGVLAAWPLAVVKGVPGAAGKGEGSP